MLKEIESFLFLGLWNTAEIFRTPFRMHRKYFSYKWCPLGENHSILVREGKAPTVCTSVWCYFPWMRGFGLQGDQFDRLLRVQVLLYCPWKRTFSIAIGSYPGINTVTKVFTSDFILLCVKGSQNVAYKLFQRAVLVMCCYRGSWESHPNSFNSTKWKASRGPAAWWGWAPLQEMPGKKQDVLQSRTGISTSPPMSKHRA